MVVLDKRPHVGGNANDIVDKHGVLIHPYGPHIFHTNGTYIADPFALYRLAAIRTPCAGQGARPAFADADQH